MRRRLSFALTVAAATLVLSAPGTAAAPGPTPAPQPSPTPMAMPPGPPQPQPEPDANAGMGIDGMVPQPPIRHGNSPFLYERFALADYTLHLDPGSLIQGAAESVIGLQDPNLVALNVSLNVAASLALGVLLVVGAITTRLLAWSLQIDLLASADGPLNAVVAGLARDLYQPLIPLLLTIVCGWLIWTWMIRRRTIRGLVGIGWVFLAMTLSAIYFAAPAAVLDQGSAFTAAVSRMVLGAVGAADTQLHRGDPTVALGPTDDAELRLFGDRYWNTYVYRPWTLAEFGEMDPGGASGQPLGVELLDKHAGHSSAFDQGLQQQPPAVQNWYNGSNGGARLVIVGVALLVALAAGVVFLAAAVARLACTIVFLALLMTLPLFLLLALHPTIGRKLLVRWLELATGALWRQVVYSLFLAVMVVLVGVISTASSAGGWGVVVLCQLAAMAGVLIFRRPLLAIFGQLGGGRHFSKTQHVGSSRLAQKAHDGIGAARERTQERLPIPAFARGARAIPSSAEGAATAAHAARRSAASAGTSGAGGGAMGRASTAAKAAGGWWTLAGVAALKGGQMAVRKGEEAKRRLQGSSEHFVLNGKTGAPPARRMSEKSLSVDGGALRTYTWNRIRRRPTEPPAEALPEPKPRQRGLPNPDATPRSRSGSTGGNWSGGPTRSAPRARWVRTPGGGLVLDLNGTKVRGK